MSRRNAIKALGGGLAGILASATAPAYSQQKKVWRMQQTWPKTSPGIATGGNVFADFVTKATGGSLTIQVYSSDEIVPTFQTMEAVSNGTLEMGYGLISYWAGQVPAMNFLGTLPFGLTVQEHNAWYSYGGGNQLAEKLYAKLGVKFFLGGNTPVQPAGWYNKEIKATEDYKGLKMRVGGLGAKVLEKVGGTPVSMPLTAVPQAMQTGAIDAIEFVGPLNDLSFGLHKMAKYYYWPGWLEPSGPYDIFINERAWNTLSSTEKEIIRGGASLGLRMGVDDLLSKNASSFAQMTNELKVNVRQIPDAVLKDLAGAAFEVCDAEASKDSESKEVWNSVLAFRRQMLPYIGVAELNFMRTRTVVKFG